MFFVFNFLHSTKVATENMAFSGVDERNPNQNLQWFCVLRKGSPDDPGFCHIVVSSCCTLEERVGSGDGGASVVYVDVNNLTCS